MRTVGFVEQLTFATDEQRAAFLAQFFIAQFFGLVGLQAAVVPGELHGRQRAARGKFVERHRSMRIRCSVEGR